MRPTLCFFDLGGVAARYVPQRRLPVLAEALGAAGPEVSAAIWSSELSHRFDGGDLTTSQMSAALEERFGVALSPSELARLWCLAFLPNDPVLELAQAVARSTRTGLFTNNPPAVEQGLPLHLPTVLAPFDTAVFSHAIGARKPAPEAFHAVETRLALEPSRLALIDDSLANVEAAASRGWAALHYTEASALARELEARGWLPT